MIVKDEEEVLARALSCAKRFADEIIVVDTGSSDNSADIAKKCGATVSFFEWIDDFSAARNFSFSLATCDYIMWLDADDVVEEDSAQKIRALISGEQFDVAMLPYVNGSMRYMRERIVRRAMNFLWSDPVHEVITPREKVVNCPAEVVHKKQKQGDPVRNLSIYQKLIARGISLSERQKFYYGRELFYNKMYRQSAAVLTHFLAGDGWAVNKAEACRTLYFCHKNLGDDASALAALLHSFLYVTPRAQDCCILADEMSGRGDYALAKYWYLRALDSEEKEEDGGFFLPEYSTVYPMLGLVVAFDRLGDMETARYWNDRVGSLYPDHSSYIYNKNYFKSLAT